jgi:hypothetical protein
MKLPVDLNDLELFETTLKKMQSENIEMFKLLEQAKVTLNHARQWIKNMNTDWADNGMYKKTVDNINEFLKRVTEEK